uniref:Integrase core domain containing protein n=1 Tax=Solanum tuberosum TaxID=4113 RepID=M1DQ81_SOLTU
MFAIVQARYENFAENGLVQKFTDHIDGPPINSRTVNGVCRPQASSSENGSTAGSESTHASSSESSHDSGFESSHASGSIAKLAIGSGENEQAASSNEATSSESVPAPRNNDPTPVADEPNRWCVEGQWQIYRDTKMLNEKEKMARLITEEHNVLTGSLHTVPKIHRLFKLHKCDWMAQAPGTYNEEIMREFYASYVATLRGSIFKRANPNEQDPLTSTMVQGCPVDISRATISRFLYGPITGHSWSLNTAEFDYRGTSCGAVFSRERLSSGRVSPTKSDNQLTWDRVIMVAALVAGLEISFALMLLAEIHERAFKTSTTYPFPCLIRDGANVADTVEQAQRAPGSGTSLGRKSYRHGGAGTGR